MDYEVKIWIALLILISAASTPLVAHSYSQSDQQCLALAMYWEARGERETGMFAVGSVIMNRVSDDRFPNTTCGVVKQGGERPPCQFSWWCDGKSDRPTEQMSWRRAMSLADQLLANPPFDPTKGALYFHSKSVSPGWKLKRTARIGNHIFYR